MSDNPQISAVLAYVEARERELGEQAGQLRSRIEDLTAHLGEPDAESENLRITRKTLLAIPRPDPVEGTPRPDVPDHPAYQQILTALADAGRPMRARDLCEALDLPILPKNTEGIRHTRHPRRTRTRPVHSAPHLTAAPPHRPGTLTQLQARNGHYLTYCTLRRKTTVQ